MKSTKKDQILEANRKNNYRLKSILESTWVIGIVVFLILLVSIIMIFFYRDHQGTIFPIKESVSEVPSKIIFASDADQKENKSNRDAWGQTGDFFGGVLNPIISLGALILLFWNIRLTKKELEETRKTLDGQLFDSLFFNVINLHNNLIDGIKLSPREIFQLSRSGGYAYFEEFIHQYPDLKDVSFFDGRQVFDKVLIYIVKGNDFQKTVEKYKEFNDKQNYLLGHYFRNLYQILRLLDTQNIDFNEKKRYANILRAQLSSDELTVLFINCLDYIVDNGEFRKLLIKFELLEHISMDFFYGVYLKHVGKVPDEYLIQYHDQASGKTAFGDNPVYAKYISTPST